MVRIFISIFLLLAFVMLEGCWFMSLPSDSSEVFSKTKKDINSLIGMENKEVVALIGKPKWSVSEGKKTYQVYQWRSDDVAMMWVGYLPSPLIGKEKGAELHCILMEYDSDCKLTNYKIDSEGVGIGGSYYSNCMGVFGIKHLIKRPEVSPNPSHPVPLTESEWALNKEISSYCLNADAGVAFAQKHIGDLYYSSRLIKTDPVRAYVWYKLAAIGGDQAASISLKIVTKKLTSQQINEAEQSFEQWKPGLCEIDLREAASF